MVENKKINQKEWKAFQIMDAIGLWPSAVAVLIMVGLIFVSIVTRFFGFPIQLVEEYVAYMVAIVVLLGGSWVVKQNAHISINLIPNLLRPKPRIIVEIITLTIALIVIAFLLEIETALVIDSFKTGRTAWTIMRTPLWPVQLIMTIGFSLFAIQIVVQIVKRIKKLSLFKEME